MENKRKNAEVWCMNRRKKHTQQQQQHHQLMENRSNGMIVQKTLSKHWYPIREADCFCISFFIRLRGEKVQCGLKS